MNTRLFEKASALVALLKQRNLKIATAESCTGGMVSSYLTAVSGSSSVFEMGVTSYSNRIKAQALKVEREVLENSGAISQATASQMAENIRNLSSADIGVAVTGAAGPDPSEGHRAGYVIIALSGKAKTIVKELNISFEGRNFVREQAVSQLFDLAINHLEEVV